MACILLVVTDPCIGLVFAGVCVAHPDHQWRAAGHRDRTVL